MPGAVPAGTRSYLDELTLAGRLSVRYPVQDKTQSVQGKFLWSQRRDGTNIEIYSPLGQTLARITPSLSRMGARAMKRGRNSPLR